MASIYYASLEGDVKYVEKLLEEGTALNWSRGDGYTALHEACRNSKVGVVKVLLKHNPLINQQTNDGNTPLHLACKWGDLDIIKLLLATGQCDQGQFV